MHRNNGHTLIELMVALALAALLMVGTISLFVAQAGVIQKETQRDQAAREAQLAFDILSRLLRQAEADSIQITYPAYPSPNGDTIEVDGDAILVDFEVPQGYAIWPADGVDNAIRVTWSNDENAVLPHAVRMANTGTLSTLDDADLQTLAGGNLGLTPRVVNLDLWPLSAPGSLQTSPDEAPVAGYLLRVTVRTAKPDPSYINPLNPDGPYRHYRTYTASGVVAPRN